MTIPPDIRKAARGSGMKPLEYMLAVMNDEEAEKVRRDRMAIAAAPFVHERACDKKPAGKKELAEKAALTAGAGTEWGDDLGPAASVN